MMKISNFQFPISKSRKGGQVMLLTVLVLSAVFLTATVIAGLLLVYQLNQVTAVVDSAKAIYAADAATERGLFRVLRCNDNNGNGVFSGTRRSSDPDIKPFCDLAGPQKPLGNIPKFLNNATYQLTIEKAGKFGGTRGVHIPGVKSDEVSSIKATGSSGKSARAFEAGFQPF